MELNNYLLQEKDIKKGKYTNIGYVSYGKNGTYKKVDTIVRIGCKYKPTTTISLTPKTPKEYLSEYAINGKNGAYIQMYVSKSPKHHTHTRYFNSVGKEITKNEYELTNPTKEIVSSSNQQGIFSKRIADIVYIGKKNRVAF